MKLDSFADYECIVPMNNIKQPGILGNLLMILIHPPGAWLVEKTIEMGRFPETWRFLEPGRAFAR